VGFVDCFFGFLVGVVGLLCGVVFGGVFCFFLGFVFPPPTQKPPKTIFWPRLRSLQKSESAGGEKERLRGTLPGVIMQTHLKKSGGKKFQGRDQESTG